MDEYVVDQPEELRLYQYPAVYRFPLNAEARSFAERLTGRNLESVFSNPNTTWRSRIAVSAQAWEPETILSESLETFRLKNLVASAGRVWYEAELADSRERAFTILLADRDDLIDWQRLLVDHHFVCGESLASICSLLWGYREDYPPQGGSCSDPGRGLTILDSEVVSQWFNGAALGARWYPSLVFFSSRSGDTLLVNRHGQCGWWHAGNVGEVYVSYASLTDLAQAFHAYWQAQGRRDPNDDRWWPFDAGFQLSD